MVKHLIRWVVCLCLCATGINTAWATTLDFSFSTIGTDGWAANYSSDHEFEYTEGIVTFVKAAKQTQTIKDVPVFRDPDTGIILVMKDGKTLNGFTLNCRQWNTYTNTVILSTSTDGEKFTEHSSKEIKANDLQFSVSNLQNVKAIKLLLKSKKQVGFESIDITYGASNAKTVNIKSFTAGKDTINIFETVTTTVENNQPEWTPAYTYKSLKEAVATVNGNGDITGVAAGTAQIVVSANTSNDANYTSGKKDTLEITVLDNRELVNLTGFAATKTTLTKDENTTTTVSNDQSGWTAKYNYTSSDKSVATVDEDGVITAVAKGKATITVAVVVDAKDTEYKAGETLTKSVDIEVVNPKHTVTFLANGQSVSEEAMEEGATITFNNPDAQYIPEGQTFMGWATAEIDGTKEIAPTLVKSATVGVNDITYYAVFATASTSGNANWVKKTVSEVVSNPQDGDYAIITPDGHAFNGTINNGHGQITSEAFSFTKGEANSAPDKICQLTITKNGDNGIEIKNSDGKKLYIKSASSGNLAWANSTATGSYNWNEKGSNLSYTGCSTLLIAYKSNNTYTSFRTYTSTNQNSASVAFAYKAGITYTDYCTTVGGNVDNREYVKFSAWNTKSGETTLVKGAKLETVATLDPAACTSGSFDYESSNPEVATIDDNGVITAVAKGEATLTATFILAEDDDNYRLSKQYSQQTLTINVVNPEHTVTFMADGKVVESNEVREEEAIVFPAVTAPTGLVFAGWSAQNWEGMQYTEPAWVNTTATVMGGTDLEFVAVFARVAQKGIEVKYSLTEDQIRNVLPNIGVDTWDTIVYNDGNVVWSGYVMTRSNGKVTDGFMRIKDNGSYICFDAPYTIANVSFHSVNGSGSMTDGTFYLKAVPSFDIPSSDSFQTIPAKDTDFSIDVKGKHSKIYMQFSATTVANVSNIVLTCVTPEQYAGYATSIAATEEIHTYDVTVSACGYTTVCLPYNAVASEGATLYALKSADQNGLHFSKTDKLAAGQGYVLKGKAGEQYTLTEVLEVVDYNANLLKGVIDDTNREDLTLTGTGDYAYPWILAKDGSFKRYTGTYIPAGKAYLDGALLQNLNNGEAGAANMRVIFETTEEQQTGLDQLSNKANGSALYYNLQGQRIAQPQTGALYIEQSGRKLLLRK